jgi:hypothetical protein
MYQRRKEMLRIKALLLICCIVTLFACGKDNPISPMVISPQVLIVDVSQGEQIAELRPITVKFNKEMAHVEIMIDGPDGPKGTVALKGDTAVWTPSSSTISPGSHTIFVTGTDKSGQQLINFNPIMFFNNKLPVINPWDAISKATVADLWFPGSVGSKWVYNNVTFLLSKIELNGKPYMAVRNAASPNELSKNPLFVFRVNASQILGYADDDKKQTQAALEDELKNSLARDDVHKQLIAEGYTENEIQNARIEHESTDEWVILEKQNLTPNANWLVTRTHVSAWIRDQKVADRIQSIRAFVTDITIAKISVNQVLSDLPIANIEYNVVDEDLQGNTKNSYFLFGISVSPGIGMVLYTDGGNIKLLEYDIKK